MLLRLWAKTLSLSFSLWCGDSDEEEDVGRWSLDVLVGVVAWFAFASRAWWASRTRWRATLRFVGRASVPSNLVFVTHAAEGEDGNGQVGLEGGLEVGLKARFEFEAERMER